MQKRRVNRKILKRKAWATFSSWIKKRDKYKCVTCGANMLPSDKNCQAGHFIHGDSLDFEETNIHCQCARCNMYLHGNGIEYTLFMLDRYGKDEIERLKRLKRTRRKYTTKELEAIISQYKEGSNESSG